MSNQAKAISLGAAPGVMEIGELEKGKEYSVNFYLLTNSPTDLVTTLSYGEGKKSMFEKNVSSPYVFVPDETSEEDTSQWVKFVRSKMVVSDKNSFPVRFPDGSIINANEKASLIINVPSDAEAGYHHFEVVLSPEISAKGAGGVGVSTIGVTRPVFIFKISGKAEREGSIEGVAGARSKNNNAEIDVLFRNAGTVTISARVKSLKIYDEFGEYVNTIEGGYVKIPPKTTGILKVYWIDDNKDKQKTIRVEANVDYLTGTVSKEAMVTIPKAEVLPMKEIKMEEFPWWIIILIIGIVLLYVYWRRR